MASCASTPYLRRSTFQMNTSIHLLYKIISPDLKTVRLHASGRIIETRMTRILEAS